MDHLTAAEGPPATFAGAMSPADIHALFMARMPRRRALFPSSWFGRCYRDASSSSTGPSQKQHQDGLQRKSAFGQVDENDDASTPMTPASSSTSPFVPETTCWLCCDTLADVKQQLTNDSSSTRPGVSTAVLPTVGFFGTSAAAARQKAEQSKEGPHRDGDEVFSSTTKANVKAFAKSSSHHDLSSLKKQAQSAPSRHSDPTALAGSTDPKESTNDAPSQPAAKNDDCPLSKNSVLLAFTEYNGRWYCLRCAKLLLIHCLLPACRAAVHRDGGDALAAAIIAAKEHGFPTMEPVVKPVMFSPPRHQRSKVEPSEIVKTSHRHQGPQSGVGRGGPWGNDELDQTMSPESLGNRNRRQRKTKRLKPRRALRFVASDGEVVEFSETDSDAASEEVTDNDDDNDSVARSHDADGAHPSPTPAAIAFSSPLQFSRTINGRGGGHPPSFLAGSGRGTAVGSPGAVGSGGGSTPQAQRLRPDGIVASLSTFASPIGGGFGGMDAMAARELEKKRRLSLEQQNQCHQDPHQFESATPQQSRNGGDSSAFDSRTPQSPGVRSPELKPSDVGSPRTQRMREATTLNSTTSTVFRWECPRCGTLNVQTKPQKAVLQGAVAATSPQKTGPSASSSSTANPRKDESSGGGGGGGSGTFSICTTCKFRRQVMLCPKCKKDALSVRFCTEPGPGAVLPPKLQRRKKGKTYDPNRPQLHDVWTCPNERCKSIFLGGGACPRCRTIRRWWCGHCSSDNHWEDTQCHVCGHAHGPRFTSVDAMQRSEELRRCGIDEELQNEDEIKKEQQQLGTQRLEARICSFGSFPVPIKDDGACLFRALSFQLCRTENFHHAVRALIVEYVYDDATTFLNLLGDDLEVWVDKMLHVTEWGDEFCVLACALQFNVDIHVVTSDQGSGGGGGASSPRSWHHCIDPSKAMLPQSAKALVPRTLPPASLRFLKAAHEDSLREPRASQKIGAISQLAAVGANDEGVIPSVPVFIALVNNHHYFSMSLPDGLYGDLKVSTEDVEWGVGSSSSSSRLGAASSGGGGSTPSTPGTPAGQRSSATVSPALSPAASVTSSPGKASSGLPRSPGKPTRRTGGVGFDTSADRKILQKPKATIPSSVLPLEAAVLCDGRHVPVRTQRQMEELEMLVFMSKRAKGRGRPTTNSLEHMHARGPSVQLSTPMESPVSSPQRQKQTKDTKPEPEEKLEVQLSDTSKMAVKTEQPPLSGLKLVESTRTSKQIHQDPTCGPADSTAELTTAAKVEAVKPKEKSQPMTEMSVRERLQEEVRQRIAARAKARTEAENSSPATTTTTATTLAAEPKTAAPSGLVAKSTITVDAARAKTTDAAPAAQMSADDIIVHTAETTDDEEVVSVAPPDGTPPATPPTTPPASREASQIFPPQLSLGKAKSSTSDVPRPSDKKEKPPKAERSDARRKTLAFEEVERSLGQPKPDDGNSSDRTKSTGEDKREAALSEATASSDKKKERKETDAERQQRRAQKEEARRHMKELTFPSRRNIYNPASQQSLGRRSSTEATSTESGKGGVASSGAETQKQKLHRRGDSLSSATESPALVGSLASGESAFNAPMFDSSPLVALPPSAGSSATALASFSTSGSAVDADKDRSNRHSDDPAHQSQAEGKSGGPAKKPKRSSASLSHIAEAIDDKRAALRHSKALFFGHPVVVTVQFPHTRKPGQHALHCGELLGDYVAGSSGSALATQSLSASAGGGRGSVFGSSFLSASGREGAGRDSLPGSVGPPAALAIGPSALSSQASSVANSAASPAVFSPPLAALSTAPPIAPGSVSLRDFLKALADRFEFASLSTHQDGPPIASDERKANNEASLPPAMPYAAAQCGVFSDPFYLHSLESTVNVPQDLVECMNTAMALSGSALSAPSPASSATTTPSLQPLPAPSSENPTANAVKTSSGHPEANASGGVPKRHAASFVLQHCRTGHFLMPLRSVKWSSHHSVTKSNDKTDDETSGEKRKEELLSFSPLTLVPHHAVVDPRDCIATCLPDKSLCFVSDRSQSTKGESDNAPMSLWLLQKKFVQVPDLSALVSASPKPASAGGAAAPPTLGLAVHGKGARLFENSCGSERNVHDADQDGISKTVDVGSTVPEFASGTAVCCEMTVDAFKREIAKEAMKAAKAAAAERGLSPPPIPQLLEHAAGVASGSGSGCVISGGSTSKPTLIARVQRDAVKHRDRASLQVLYDGKDTQECCRCGHWFTPKRAHGVLSDSLNPAAQSESTASESVNLSAGADGSAGSLREHKVNFALHESEDRDAEKAAGGSLSESTKRRKVKCDHQSHVPVYKELMNPLRGLM